MDGVGASRIASFAKGGWHGRADVQVLLQLGSGMAYALKSTPQSKSRCLTQTAARFTAIKLLLGGSESEQGAQQVGRLAAPFSKLHWGLTCSCCIFLP